MGIYLERFITEEVDLFKTFVLNMSERVGLVPAIGENVKRDLTTNGKRQAIVCKFLLQDLDKSCSHTVYLKKLQLQWQGKPTRKTNLIVSLKFMTFLNTLLSSSLDTLVIVVRGRRGARRVTSDRTDIDHAISEFDERAANFVG